MGNSKTKDFSVEQIDLARLAKALAHPARVAILQHLVRVNACIGGEIVEVLPLAQPTVSRHLRELKEVGLIKGEIEGVKVNYCIDRKRWEAAKAMMDSLFGAAIGDQDCC